MNDANGSMTADESGRVFVYDAWNRLAAVRNLSNSPIVTYSIDALGRRIIEDRPNANTVDQLYFSAGWQVLEERRNGTASGDVRRQYFRSIDYVDALTSRVDYASERFQPSFIPSTTPTGTSPPSPTQLPASWKDTLTTPTAMSPCFTPIGRFAAARLTAGTICTRAGDWMSIPIFTTTDTAITQVLLAAGRKRTPSAYPQEIAIYIGTSAILR